MSDNLTDAVAHMAFTVTVPDPQPATMPTAEAVPLRMQAAGLEAELNLWQRQHPTVADCRLTDAINAARLLTHALDHLATGTEYAESAAARQEWMATHDRDVVVLSEQTPIHLDLTGADDPH